MAKTWFLTQKDGIVSRLLPSEVARRRLQQPRWFLNMNRGRPGRRKILMQGSYLYLTLTRHQHTTRREALFSLNVK